MKKLNKIYKEILTEDLEYAHSNTKGEEDDEYQIGMVKEVNENDVIIAYHGTPQKISRFVDDFVGGPNATDQEGPGIYFTTKSEEAIKYATPNGYVYKVELHPKKLLSNNKGFDSQNLSKSVLRLIKMAPNWKGIAMGYDDDINEGLNEMVYRFINMGGSERGVFIKLYHEVFKENPKIFVKGMVKLGYDALFLASNDGNGGHIVVYNPRIIKIVDIKQNISQNESTDLGIHNADYNANYDGYSY